MSLFSQAGYIATFFKPRVYCPYYRAVQLVFHPDFRFYTRSTRGQSRHIANYYLDIHFKKSIDVLPCQPRVTVTPCYVHKATSDLESIYHPCINPIHRIGPNTQAIHIDSRTSKRSTHVTVPPQQVKQSTTSPPLLAGTTVYSNIISQASFKTSQGINCTYVLWHFDAECEKERSYSAERDLGIHKAPFSCDLRENE